MTKAGARSVIRCVAPVAALLALLAVRNGLRLELGGEPRLVTALEHPRLADDRADSVGRLRADVQPVLDACFVERDRTFGLPRGIRADDLDEAAVARADRRCGH